MAEGKKERKNRDTNSEGNTRREKSFA